MAHVHAVQYPSQAPVDDIQALLALVTGGEPESLGHIVHSAWCCQGYAQSLIFSEDGTAPRMTAADQPAIEPTNENVKAALESLLPGEDDGKRKALPAWSVPLLKMLLQWLSDYLLSKLGS